MIDGRGAAVNRLLLILILGTVAGCHSAPKVVVRAVPSHRDVDKYEFAVEIVPQFSYTR